MRFFEGKVGCILPMVVISRLPHPEFGPNHHQEDVPHFICPQKDLFALRRLDLMASTKFQLVHSLAFF